MTGDDAKASGKPGKETAEERRQRLAAELRKNLARRKAQGRARKAAGAGEADPPAGPER